jgi:hypothetical protein
MRKLLPSNEAATSEIILALAIRRTKLISNQLGLYVVYLPSCVPSEIKIIQSWIYKFSQMWRLLRIIGSSINGELMGLSGSEPCVNLVRLRWCKEE